MPIATRNLPAFVSLLASESDEKRSDLLAHTHPDYDENADDWTALLDAFEGSGGFKDGNYLWPYRFETATDFDKRRKMARYHNYVETVIDLYVRHVFSQPPKRQTTNKTLEEFWQDVDGAGNDIDSFMRGQTALALAAGHTGVLMDTTQDEPTGPTKADQRARPFLASYVATAILDWRQQHSRIAAIKLCEAVPDVGIAEEPPEGEEAKRFLLWDEEGWARFDHKGELIDGDTPGLELVPFEVIRPKPSIVKPFLGRPLFNNANTIKALFNRMSEEDEVLRNQAFSILTVEVAPEGDVEAAKKALGEQIGTSRAHVVAGKIKYESPDMSTAECVRANALQVIRELYRVAHMRYERDSLDAESAEAIRLQYTELNEMLQGLASELQRVEMQLARFYFAWTEATPELAEAAFEAAEVSIQYAEEFFLDDLIDDLAAWVQAIQMGLGKQMEILLKIKAVKRLEPDMSLEQFKEIESEIKALPASSELMLGGASDQLRKNAEGLLKKLQPKPQTPKTVTEDVSSG